MALNAVVACAIEANTWPTPSMLALWRRIDVADGHRSAGQPPACPSLVERHHRGEPRQVRHPLDRGRGSRNRNGWPSLPRGLEVRIRPLVPGLFFGSPRLYGLCTDYPSSPSPPRSFLWPFKLSNPNGGSRPRKFKQFIEGAFPTTSLALALVVVIAVADGIDPSCDRWRARQARVAHQHARPQVQLSANERRVDGEVCVASDFATPGQNAGRSLSLSLSSLFSASSERERRGFSSLPSRGSWTFAFASGFVFWVPTRSRLAALRACSADCLSLSRRLLARSLLLLLQVTVCDPGGRRDPVRKPAQQEGARALCRL